MPGFRKLVVLVAALLAAAGLALPAVAKPPIEAFGDFPEIRAMDISPDGSRLTFINRLNGRDYLALYDAASGTTKSLASVTELKARSVQFVGNNYIVLVASKTLSIYGFRGRHDISAAFSYNLATGKIVQLLTRTENVFPGQSNLGDIVGVDPGGKFVYMPIYVGYTTVDPSLHLMRVSLETGKGEVAKKGTPTTIDWVVDASGNPIMREEFSEKQKVHEVRAYAGDNAKTIYTNHTDLPEISVVGATSDGKSLIATANNESDFLSLYRMDRTDGSMTGPVFERADAEVDGVIVDANRIVYGVRYSGMRPSYDMIDKDLQNDIRLAQNSFPSASVALSGWTADWSKLLLFVSGGSETESYVLFERNPKKLVVVTRGRSLVKPEDIGEVITMEYKARDGLKIPGLITWPAGVPADQRKKLPLVVMPHGGPEAYDSIGYDWLAQFIANEGYAVLQPNFRGSGGFGSVFAEAGHGEWGRKMQDDITDGVNAMIKMGWADANRICVVGWSYGGYAALAGGALTPDLYKCVVSVAGVSNLREMLADERRKYGPRSRIVTYWQNLIGDPDKDREAIDAVSPSRIAANFKAPVLLIHGTDDTTVPARQSDMMNDALKNASKPVEYIRIKGDDHGLVDNESRRTALTKMAEFLGKYLK